ncbi:hypothetical protein GOP47_0029911 [Adiantum capillus-veneris]|nr:hypothetical protein GOP47_0029911 [Adiantum capillus-veneris]
MGKRNGWEWAIWDMEERISESYRAFGRSLPLSAVVLLRLSNGGEGYEATDFRVARAFCEQARVAREESDEETHMHSKQSSSPSDKTRPSVLQKLSHGLVKTDLKGSFGSRLAQMKGMLMEKLASMPTIPADSLEHARHSIESIIADATQSAYGKTKDAMLHIRLKLIEIIPSLSPHETKKIVDDVEREVNDMSKADGAECRQQAKAKAVNEDGRLGVTTPTASAAIVSQPTSGFVANMDRLRAWALRSRL